MNSARITTIGGLALTVSLLFCCGRTTTSSEKTAFSKNDSLTDRYLNMHDTLLHVWNKLVHHEKEKIGALDDVFEKLMSHQQGDASLHTRLRQIKELHLTPKLISNPDVLAEYDFAHESLINEILALAGTDQLATDREFQALVDRIRIAKSNISLSREDYDSIAQAFNDFLQTHRAVLKEIDQNCNLDPRPLFNPLVKK